MAYSKLANERDKNRDRETVLSRLLSRTSRPGQRALWDGPSCMNLNRKKRDVPLCPRWDICLPVPPLPPFRGEGGGTNGTGRRISA